MKNILIDKKIEKNRKNIPTVCLIYNELLISLRDSRDLAILSVNMAVDIIDT